MRRIFGFILALITLVFGVVVLLAPFTWAAAAAHLAHPGDLDPTFGSGGLVTTAIGASSEAKAVAVQPDGKIVAGGYGGGGAALARYRSDGALDGTFGSGGTVTTPQFDVANDVAVQRDGTIVVAGGNFTVARYRPDGTLDSKFGSGGLATAFDTATFKTARALGIERDGRIVAAGQARVGGRSFFALARFHRNGKLDRSFGTDGTVLTAIGPDVEAGAGILDVALAPDRGILAAGFVTSALVDAALALYTRDGSLDPTLGGAGFVTTELGDSTALNGLALRRDGKIVATGRATDIRQGLIVVRYNADGSLDTSFNGTGVVGTTGDRCSSEIGNAVLLSGARRTVAVGTAHRGQAIFDDTGHIVGCNPLPDAFLLARYNGDGSPDSTFGTGGLVETSFDPTSYSGANAAAVQPDRKIVAAGYRRDGPFDSQPSTFALARYLVGAGDENDVVR